MMQLRLGNVIVVVCLAALVVLTSCSPSTGPEIRIGLISYDPKGSLGIEGQFMSSAANLAVDESNQSGGLELSGVKHPVRLVKIELPDGPSPEAATHAVNQLINQDNVVAIIGPDYSSEAIPVGQVAEMAHIPLISPVASNAQVTAGRRYVFRICFVDDFQGQALAVFARRTLGAQRAAVLYDISDSYSRGIATVFQDQFQKLGGEVAASESFTPDVLDFNLQLAAIKQADADVLVLPELTDTATLAGTQARQLGLLMPLLGSDGWSRQKMAVLPAFADAYMTANWVRTVPSDKSLAFVQRYEAKYGVEAGDTAALTYDAFQMVFAAVRFKGRADPEAIRDGLYAMGPYEGVSGTIQFVDSGDPMRSAVILQFKAGQAVYFDMVKP